MGLDLADSDDGSLRLRVDILIRCDHYWDLVTGSVCRTEKGSTAIHTKLGLVLSGSTLQYTTMLCVSTHTITTHLL